MGSRLSVAMSECAEFLGHFVTSDIPLAPTVNEYSALRYPTNYHPLSGEEVSRDCEGFSLLFGDRHFGFGFRQILHLKKG